MPPRRNPLVLPLEIQLKNDLKLFIERFVFDGVVSHEVTYGKNWQESQPVIHSVHELDPELAKAADEAAQLTKEFLDENRIDIDLPGQRQIARKFLETAIQEELSRHKEEKERQEQEKNISGYDLEKERDR